MPAQSESSPVFRAVIATFKKMGWSGHRVEGREVLEADFEAHHTKMRLHVQAFPELNAVSVVAVASSKVPDSRSGVVAEMLMRLNHDLTIGNFELDYDMCSVLFRVANIFPDGQYDQTILASLVHSAVAEVDRLTPFLTLVLRMNQEELSKLNLPLFLQREDLLPPAALTTHEM